MNDINILADQPIAWTPTPDIIERAQLTKFMRQVGVSTWYDLYQFSIRDVEQFTEEVLKFLNIRFDPQYEKLLDTSNGVEFPKWFSGSGDTPVPIGGSSAESASERRSDVHGDKSVPAPAGLNITEMCLDRWQTDEMKDQPAVIWEGEDGAQETLTYSVLLGKVNKCTAGLRSRGLRKGEAIGIHMPMLDETVIALLAINRIGGLAVPVFSGYGVEAIVSRMNAVGAKALFTCPNFQRRGKYALSSPVGLEAAGKCPTVKTVFEITPKQGLRRPLSVEEKQERKRQLASEKADWRRELEAAYVQTLEAGKPDHFEKVRSPEYPFRRILWHQLLDVPADDLSTRIEPTSAEDPLIILYTSGTTGKPKGIAHTHASFPIKAAQDMAFGTDVGKGTRICWYTDIGWMMGPWLIYGALINGATICIYDGAPDYPTPDRMWEFCAKHKVEVLGISPTLVRSLARSGDTPVPIAGSSAESVSERRSDVHRGKSVPAPYECHDLSSLRIFASTGEPWNPAPWWWLFEKVGNSKLPIINYSGGTEISGGILMGNPLLPIKPCSFPAPCPGMDVDILDENGQSVGPNHVGELVIRQPWIGMARGFWQEKERYLETYWSRFKNIWFHGDWAMRDADGHWFILGRSDDTLKVAGKRVGPAEVESILVSHPQVAEAAVIGVPDEVKGTAMVAFCVGTQAALPSSDPEAKTHAERLSAFQQELKSLVARDMGKPLAPSRIHFVSALPKTRNAKVMRRVIRAAYLGEDAGDLSALENPGSLREIQELSTQDG